MLVAWMLSNMSCTRLPPAVSYVPAKVQIANFMKDCFAGNVNGISTSHVNYVVKVQVEIKNSGGGLSLAQSNIVSSPSTPDKSMMEIPIDVPKDVAYKLTVFVDATECSKCGATFCNPSTIFENGAIYTITGKPYWTAEGIYSRAPASGVMAVTPGASFRYPNQPSPNDCNCKIRN